MPSYEKISAEIPKSIKHIFPDPKEGKKKASAKMHKKIATTYILWIIEKEPMTGYQLMKKLKEDHQESLSKPSRIYPFLVNLETQGLLRSKILKKGKRESKQYTITPKGKLVISTSRKILSQMLWGEFLQDISRR
jgi:DNA-binding PadR family transcriptional regulator